METFGCTWLSRIGRIGGGLYFSLRSGSRVGCCVVLLGCRLSWEQFAGLAWRRIRRRINTVLCSYGYSTLTCCELCS